MVLESLVSPVTAEKKPWELFFLGFLYASVAMFISIQIFDSNAGLLAVFLTVVASIPLMYGTIKYEELKDTWNIKEIALLKEHSKALTAFMLLFLGITVAFSLWYIFLPPGKAITVFSIQIQTINEINAITTGFSANLNVLSQIFLNNIKVLTFCILFSFFYGAGAIFILTWNASVISVATGTIFRNKIAEYTLSAGFPNIAAYFHVFSISFMRYMTHGFFEILAYFIAGLAGGIISVAIIQHDFRSEKFMKILLDASDLIFIAIGVLFFAALVEIYITPALF